MKHARKALVFLILLVTPLLLAGVLPPAIYNEAEATISPITTKVNLPSYDNQTPILAFSDFDMDNYASSLSWEGNGMPDTPYIIEGYNITDDADCILIQDTTRAFEIRDCYISSFGGDHGNGIILYNVTQAGIFDTVVEDKSDAIIMTLASATIIDNCTLRNSSTGLDMAASPGTTINDCDIYNIVGEAIRFIDCNNTMISENEIHDTFIGSGIQFHLSYGVNIVNNQIYNCQSSGVWVVHSPYATIENNVIHDNDFFTGPMCGVHLDNSPYASIVGNEIYDNSRNGIYVQESDFVYIFDNHIYGNSDHGIDAIFSNNGTIAENNIHENGWWPKIINALCGIHMFMAEDWYVAGNSISNNTPSGIALSSVTNITFEDNNIFLNGEYGIYVEMSWYVDIIENVISENGWDAPNDWTGAAIQYHASGSRIIGNEIYNNANYGFYGLGQDNVVQGNTIYDNMEWGIGIAMASGYLIHENVVYNHSIGIYSYSGWSNITDNIVYDNGIGIHLYATGNCRIWGNDIGWNTLNAQQNISQSTNLWYDSATETGNHWHDYNGGGIYWIFNSTHGVASDNYPSISLNVSQASPITYEILETGNILVWQAYALNPLDYHVWVDDVYQFGETWDGGEIVLDVDDLPHGIHEVMISVFHISGHGLAGDSNVTVEDLTAPEAIGGYELIVLTVGDTLSEQFSSTDPSGISWAVNDTVNFEISSTGLLTALTDLTVGDYVVRISATDPYGHTTTLDVTIRVIPDPGVGDPTTLILAIGGIGAVGVIVVVIVLYKTKKG